MHLSTYLSKHNLTYSAFAEKIGMTRIGAGMNIYRYCTGQRIPKPDTASKIVAATNGKVGLEDIYAVNGDSHAA